MADEVLTLENEQYLRENSRELVRQSLRELAAWRRTRNVVFLQQAGEKAFSALEQVTSVRSHKEFDSHTSFTKVFRKVFPGKNEVLQDANILHQFFYNGKVFEPETRIIEEKYHRVIKFVRSVKM